MTLRFALPRRSFVAGLAAASIAGITPRGRAQAVTRVGVFDGPGVGGEALEAAMRSLEAARMRGERCSAERIRGDASSFDAVLFTGGRGSLQGRALGEEGRAALRAAIRAGLGYVGICGGSYLACQGEAEFHKLSIVAARHATGDAWMRGIAPARLIPEDGSAPATLHYANGPLFSIEAVEGLSPPSVLARFGTEISLPEHDTHPGEMLHAPALITATFGAGRVVLFSPNPNLEPTRDDLLIAALRAAARGATSPLSTWRAVFG